MACRVPNCAICARIAKKTQAAAPFTAAALGATPMTAADITGIEVKRNQWVIERRYEVGYRRRFNKPMAKFLVTRGSYTRAAADAMCEQRSRGSWTDKVVGVFTPAAPTIKRIKVDDLKAGSLLFSKRTGDTRVVLHDETTDTYALADFNTARIDHRYSSLEALVVALNCDTTNNYIVDRK